MYLFNIRKSANTFCFICYFFFSCLMFFAINYLSLMFFSYICIV